MRFDWRMVRRVAILVAVSLGLAAGADSPSCWNGLGKEKIHVRGTGRDLMRLNLKGDDFDWTLFGSMNRIISSSYEWRSLAIRPRHSGIRLELPGGTSQTAPGKHIVNG